MAARLYEALAPVFERWWKELNDSDDQGARGDLADRADIARLRRVGVITFEAGPQPDVALALTVDAFRKLYLRVQKFMGRTRQANYGGWEEDLVVAAVTLAHVRHNVPGTTAALLGGSSEPENRLMAEGRFLALMRVATTAELLEQARRVAALLKSGAPVGDLGASLMVWLDDPSRRREWAKAYYGLGARPSVTPDISSELQSETGAV